MTIEQELLNNTPLPLDIIKFCIEPFLIPDQNYWRRKFDTVLKDVLYYQDAINQLYLTGQNARLWNRKYFGSRSLIMRFKYKKENTGLYYLSHYEIVPIPLSSLLSRILSWFNPNKILKVELSLDVWTGRI